MGTRAPIKREVRIPKPIRREATPRPVPVRRPEQPPVREPVHV